MKKGILILSAIVVTFLLTIACMNYRDTGRFSLDCMFSKTTTNSKKYTSTIDAIEIQKEYKSWYAYTKKNIELSSEFLPINSNNKQITKESFLTRLKTGTFIPLQLTGSIHSYKLYKLTASADPKIGKSIKGIASIANHYFQKEGQEVPSFDFTDLNEINYSSENTKDKIVVFKCWFITCKVCVEEFPELNELYDRYQDNKEVVFISLAFDKPDKLQKFLEKKEFKYPVIAEQKKYMAKKLQVKQYPTHLLIKNGKIVKMVNNVHALITSLDAMTGNTSH